ncbi:MAG TPA: MBL fold metallo-hydrolase [Thermomicrobiaceae bacterium]|nr:MBL fold metallo-hydrolase [Thermomicrobiaceae bacterium]
MANPRVEQLEPGLWGIDLNFLGVPGTIASYLLAGGDDDLTLIETGPTTTIDALLAGVRAAGFDPEQITQLAVTHIHLDHAGASGALMRRLPRARLLVHRVGAPHMVEPSKLLASATRIYGDDMDRLWGEVVPVPEDRVVILDDASTFSAGGRALTALYTPGHASHHVAYLDPATGGIFTGDVGAVRLDRADYVRPPTVPPEFDPELWRQSVARLRALRPNRLFLTHFGAFDDPEWHFDDLLLRLGNWMGWVDARLEETPDTVAVIEQLRRRGDGEIVELTGSDALVWPYEVATSYKMTVDGMARYFRKRRRPPAAAG